MDACPKCSPHDVHTGRCFASKNLIQCGCPKRIAPEDADLGVDTDALAKHQINRALRQHGEVLITKDDES